MATEGQGLLSDANLVDELERFVPSKALAIQLLLGLNPKRGGRSPYPVRAFPKNAHAAPRLRIYALGGKEPPQQGGTLWLRLL